MEKYRDSSTGPQGAQQPPSDRTAGKTAMVALFGTLSALYLMLPLGALDITDYLPIVGNFDEATAVLVLIAALRYFGLDITRWIQFAKNVNIPGEPTPRRTEKVVSPNTPDVEEARRATFR